MSNSSQIPAYILFQTFNINFVILLNVLLLLLLLTFYFENLCILQLIIIINNISFRFTILVWEIMLAMVMTTLVQDVVFGKLDLMALVSTSCDIHKGGNSRRFDQVIWTQFIWSYDLLGTQAVGGSWPMGSGPRSLRDKITIKTTQT